MSYSYEPPKHAIDGLMHLVRDDHGQTLEDLGRRLVSRYPWPLRDAAWFVITGEQPEIEPLQVGLDGSSGRHSIDFLPWVSERTVRYAYRSIQHSDNRPLGNKSLSAFRFVDKHTEPGRTPKWAELVDLWNREHPDEGDEFTDRSALRKAYRRAEKRLASPWVNERDQLR